MNKDNIVDSSYLCKENRIRQVSGFNPKDDYVVYELRGKLSVCYRCDKYTDFGESGKYCCEKKE